MNRCRLSLRVLRLMSFLMSAQVVLALLVLPALARDPRELFPPELVQFTPYASNPIFMAAPAGKWDSRIRERGWILHEGDRYHMWYTGYDGGSKSKRLLGYATSKDGLAWNRYAGNPIYREHWVEDMMVVHHAGTFYMFAEGLDDQAQWLTSPDGIHWTRQGTLDIRYTNGKPITPGPFGTPTVWRQPDGSWRLLYERGDAGIWLAKSNDLKRWDHVQDEPVLRPGPADNDRLLIAANQVIFYQGRYYLLYHGTSTPLSPRTWTTNIATSTDLIHWVKYPGNPLVSGNRSSGILVPDGDKFRLYTMHDRVEVFLPTVAKPGVPTK